MSKPLARLVRDYKMFIRPILDTKSVQAFFISKRSGKRIVNVSQSLIIPTVEAIVGKHITLTNNRKSLATASSDVVGGT
jgi:hypothetical protein